MCEMEDHYNKVYHDRYTKLYKSFFENYIHIKENQDYNQDDLMKRYMIKRVDFIKDCFFDQPKLKKNNAPSQRNAFVNDLLKSFDYELSRFKKDNRYTRYTKVYIPKLRNQHREWYNESKSKQAYEWGAEEFLYKKNEKELLRYIAEFKAYEMFLKVYNNQKEILTLEEYKRRKKQESLNGIFSDTSKVKYISPDLDVKFEDIQESILKEINSARFLIWIAIAWFTDKKIFDALVKKSKEGVTIEIVILKDDKNNLGFERYFDTYWASKRKGLMHNKFCIIDLEICIAGSYNFTNYAALFNDENMMIQKGMNSVLEYATEFVRLKKQYKKIVD